MKIQFKDRKVRKLCESQSAAQKKLGADCARKLRTRLSDLESVARVSELIAGNPHPLKGSRAGQFALRLAGGRRLVFSPVHDARPTKAGGSIDWTKVTAIRVDYIGDYHD